MTAPWHHRRLHTRPGGVRQSGAVRLRAHELALGAWFRSVGRLALRPVALLSPREAVALRTRLWRRENNVSAGRTGKETP